MPRWKCISLFLLIISSFLLNSHPAYASDISSSWRSFTTKEGLPANRTLTFVQSLDNRFWVGTEKGLAYFFDKSFRAESLYGNDSSSIKTEQEPVINSLLNTRDGKLWVATNIGLFFRSTNNEWIRPQNVDVLKGEIWALWEDHKGRLWAGGEFGLDRYDGSQWEKMLFDNAASRVKALIEDKQGLIWIATANKIYVLKDDLVIKVFTVSDGLPIGTELMKIIEDYQGDIWVATLGGLIQLRDFSIYRIFTEEDGLASNHIYSLLIDLDGKLWVGSEGGLNRLDKELVKIHYSSNNGLAGDWVQALYIDSEGSLWAGTNTGITRIPTSNWQVETNPLLSNSSVNTIWIHPREIAYAAIPGGLAIRNPDGSWALKSSNRSLGQINALYQRNSKQLLVGTSNGLVFLEDDFVINRVLETETVFALHVTNDEVLWIGTNLGLYYLPLDANAPKLFEGLQGLQIKTLWETRGGEIWIGTMGDGAYCLQIRDLSPCSNNREHITWLNTREGLESDIVFSGIEDKDGNLWFGTSGGLCRLTTIADPFRKDSWFSFKGTLNGTMVFSLLEDMIYPFYIWVGTESGLNLIMGNEVSSFSRRDGISHNWVNALAQGIDGKLWIATQQSLTYHFDFRQAPEVFSFNLTANDDVCGRNCSSIVVDYDVGSVNIEILASDLGDFEGIQYLVEVTSTSQGEQAQPEWLPSKSNSIKYRLPETGLFQASGIYSISVRAYDRHYNYSPISSRKLVIVPPPTLSQFLDDRPWLQFLVILISAGGLLAVVILGWIAYRRSLLHTFPINLDVYISDIVSNQSRKVSITARSRKLIFWSSLHQQSSFWLNQEEVELATEVAQEINNDPLISKERIYKIGAHLNNALFTNLNIELKKMIEKNRNARIRIHLPNNNQICSLPWEFLHLNFNKEPKIGSETNLMVIRDFTSNNSSNQTNHGFLPREAIKKSIEFAKLKVLLVCINQKPEFGQLHQLKNEEEEILHSYKNAFKENNIVILQYPPTWKNFEREMRGGYHIVHFSCHGGIQETTYRTKDGIKKISENVIYFQGDDGNPHPISQEKLVNLFLSNQAGGDIVRTGLVVLNACQSAMNLEGIRGLSEALVQESGVPAVIGMGYKISEESAVDFAAEFYKKFFQHFQVDFAVREGRRALRIRKGAQGRDWGVPRLYTCTHLDQLFQQI